MLTSLIESNRRSKRSIGGTVASVVAHAAVITLAAAVTAHASDDVPTTRAPIPDVIYLAVPEASPARGHTTSARTRPDVESPLPAPPAPTIDVPVTIPTSIPVVDLSNLTVLPTDFAIGARTRSASAADGSMSNSRGGTLTAGQVEKETRPLPGNPKPRYPSVLQSAHVDGEVLAQFVVDTSGRVDMSTFSALDATDELFVGAVKRVLPLWKFQPAEVAGRKVKQLVQMPLTFRVR